MKVTASVKIDKDIKEEASKLANDLGLTFSGVVNAFLTNFVKEKRLVISQEPELNDSIKSYLREVLDDVKKGNNLSKSFSNVEDLKKDLEN